MRSLALLTLLVAPLAAAYKALAALPHPLFQAITHLELSRLGHQFSHECVVNTLLNQNPIRADTGLPAVSVLGDQSTLDCGIDVRVLKDDKWRIAA